MTLTQFTLSDGSMVLLQTDDMGGGLFEAGTSAGEAHIVAAQKTFTQALAGVRAAAQDILESISELAADEIEVTFGIKMIGELSLFAVGKVGADANYEVKMTWKDSRDRHTTQ